MTSGTGDAIAPEPSSLAIAPVWPLPASALIQRLAPHNDIADAQARATTAHR